MKVILVARKALAEYLISSAVSMLVATIGVSIRYRGRYSRRRVAKAASLSAPITTRSGRMKSPTALPSRRNSGLLATWIARSGRMRLTISLICRPVPTGTVDLVTSTSPSRLAARATPSAAA